MPIIRRQTSLRACLDICLTLYEYQLQPKILRQCIMILAMLALKWKGSGYFDPATEGVHALLASSDMICNPKSGSSVVLSHGLASGVINWKPQARTSPNSKFCNKRRLSQQDSPSNSWILSLKLNAPKTMDDPLPKIQGLAAVLRD